MNGSITPVVLALLLGLAAPACKSFDKSPNPECATDSDCPQGHKCSAEGVCECVPDCGDRECGLDPTCNTRDCGACQDSQECSAQGLCVAAGCTSHASMGCSPQPGAGADAVWFDSCGNQEEVIQDCPDLNGTCDLDADGNPACGCVDHFDPQQNCAACLSGWIEPDCRQVAPSFSLTLDFNPSGPGATPMPAVLRPGAYYGKADEPDRAAFATLEQNSGRIGWGLDWFISERTALTTPNLQAFVSQMKESDLMWNVVMSAVDVLNSGGVPIIEVFGTPEYLSSCPGAADFRICPPTSYEDYADLVEAIAEYFAVDAALGNSVAYEVWNEPDNRYWQGSYLDYFELYKSAALGIYRAYTSNELPLPSIGGPATSTASGGIVETGQGESSNWMVEFLAYVATTPLEDPQFSYPSLPLNFVSYHNYTFDYANQLGRSVSTVRQWLADSGLDRNTPIALTEWGTWFDEFDLTFSNPFFERLDSEVQAAHTVAGVIMMDYYGVDYHAYSNLSDWALSNHGPNGGLLPAFHGSSDIFNHYNRPKPVFNAFRMLNVVAGLDRKVPVDGLWADEWYKAHAFIKAVAGVSDDGTRGAILIANSIPDRIKLYSDAIIAWFTETSQDYSEEEISAAATQLLDPAIQEGPPVGLVEMLDGPRCGSYPCLLDDMRDSNGQPLTALLYNALGAAANYILETDPLRTAGHNVVLTLTNTPAGVIRVYPLDRTHANPHAAYMGVWSTHGIGFTDFGALDISEGTQDYAIEAEALQAAVACEDLVMIGEAPATSNQTIPIWVDPDSVNLVTFSVEPMIDHVDPATSGCEYR